MLSLEDRSFPEGRRLKAAIWDAVRGALEKWTGETLKPTSLYGIRVYKEGAILAPHVDRLPLVTSAIINVASDLDEDWPLEVYSHDGVAHNVSMKPGDMVMYESHTVVHGRPYPLKGRSFANIFVHFEPIDAQGRRKNEGSSESLRYPEPHHDANRLVAKTKLRAAQPGDGLKYYQHHDHDEGVTEGMGGREVADRAADAHSGRGAMGSRKWAKEQAGAAAKEKALDGDPSWGVEGAGDEAAAVREEADEAAALFATGSTSLHVAAARGDLVEVRKPHYPLAKLQPAISSCNRVCFNIHFALQVKRRLAEGSDVLGADSNNWHALHEAARGGHLEVVKELVKSGADLGATTLEGGSPLWWARETHGENHEVVAYLRSIGAPDIDAGHEL